MNIFSKIIKNTAMTLALPGGMFIFFFILTRASGIEYYGTNIMWLSIFNSACFSATVAFGIALQIRAGRFDFTGGINFVLAALIGGRLYLQFNLDPWVMLLACIVVGVLISMTTALVYIFARLPVIICTIGMTLLYESLTLILYDGEGVNIINKTRITIFGRYPWILVVLAIAVLIYFLFTEFSVTGYQSRHLASNQQVAVNIGIREKKNILITYLISGIIFGLAAAIYLSQNRVQPQSNISTAGTLFSNLTAVYIGLFLGRFSNQTIGLLAGTLAVSFFSFGLDAMGLTGGWSTILFALVFMLGFNAITINITRIRQAIRNKKSRSKIPTPNI